MLGENDSLRVRTNDVLSPPERKLMRGSGEVPKTTNEPPVRVPMANGFQLNFLVWVGAPSSENRLCPECATKRARFVNRDNIGLKLASATQEAIHTFLYVSSL